MKKISVDKIKATIEQMFIDTCYKLSPDVLDAIKQSIETEISDNAKDILAKLVENAHIAENEKIPLCQDTGLAIVFIEIGSKIEIIPPGSCLTTAINDAVKAAYEKGSLRKSVVAEPLKDRTNTQTNTPCIIHYSCNDSDQLNIAVMAKGGGCENKSQFKMFNPTAEKSEIIDWITDVVKQAGANACPPFVVGVGIGGNFEQCCTISKKALLRDIGNYNSDEFYAQMEKELLCKINALNIGPQGLTGSTTALAVQIETAPCHIASLPVAVNIECHSHRHKKITL